MGRTQREREGGATLVEFAFVSLLLFTLMFGIVGYGVLLSFKQTVTHAANEAARSGAIIADNTTTPTDEREDAANASVTRFESWGRDCSHPQMTCEIDVHDCATGPGSGNDNLVFPDCITVRLTYDYAAAPIVPNFPLISALMPSTVESVATAELSFPDPPPPTP